MNKNEPDIKDVIESILIAINAAEGSTLAQSCDVRSHLLDSLFEITTCLEKSGLYDTDKKLSSLDKVFKDAGWDNQGFRWRTNTEQKRHILFGDIS
jgi:hypothetical protein